MKLEQRLKQIVCTTLKIPENIYTEELGAGDILEWDSLGHTQILQSVEMEFNIAFDVGDAIAIENIGDLLATIRQYVHSGEK